MQVFKIYPLLVSFWTKAPVKCLLFDLFINVSGNCYRKKSVICTVKKINEIYLLNALYVHLFHVPSSQSKALPVLLFLFFCFCLFGYKIEVRNRSQPKIISK